MDSAALALRAQRNVVHGTKNTQARRPLRSHALAHAATYIYTWGRQYQSAQSTMQPLRSCVTNRHDSSLRMDGWMVEAVRPGTPPYQLGYRTKTAVSAAMKSCERRPSVSSNACRLCAWELARRRSSDSLATLLLMA